jgi:hypothetical protein
MVACLWPREKRILLALCIPTCRRQAIQTEVPSKTHGLNGRQYAEGKARMHAVDNLESSYHDLLSGRGKNSQ